MELTAVILYILLQDSFDEFSTQNLNNDNKTLESIANNFISCDSPTTEAWIKLSAFLQFSQDVANILSLFNVEEF